MNEQWSWWEPFPYSQTHRYYIHRIDDNKKGLKIILQRTDCENKTVEILFKKSVIAYSSTEESLVEKTLTYLDENYEEHFYGKWPFFKIKNSRYIKRLSERFGSHFDDFSRWLHFALITDDELIDIIADYEPEVSLVSWNIMTFMLLYKERMLPVITRHFPDANIILYGLRARGEMVEKTQGTTPIQIALDTGYKIEQKKISELENSIKEEAHIGGPCEIVDLNSVSEELRKEILQEAIEWKKVRAA